jgi:hypothetical protein
MIEPALSGEEQTAVMADEESSLGLRGFHFDTIRT